MKVSNCPSNRSVTRKWILNFAALAVVTLCATSAVSAFVPQASSMIAVKSALYAGLEESETSFDGERNCLSRRETLSKTASSILVAAAAAGISFPEESLAADATKQEIIAKLAGIPTFALVNGPGAGPELDGVPFDIYDPNSAKATGYFFMSYATAQQALEQASNLDSARGDGNIWATAKIKVVPLSVAVQLALVGRRRVAVNEEEGVKGIKVDTFHNIIPSDDGNGDAQRLDTSRGKNVKIWETKGRVPLFYIPEPSVKKNFYYFDTNSLISSYKRNHPNDPAMTFIPEIQVVELIDNFRKAQSSNDWEALRDFAETIQPSAEARQDAIKLLTEEASKKSAPYNFDKTFLVITAKK